MADIYESLEKLGLTRNEVTIYKYLLRKGMSTGRQIYIENSLDKSSSYRAISELQEKGLIYAIGETRNQKFSAHSGEALMQLHEKVTEDLENSKKDIKSFLDDVSSYAKEHYKSSRISIYEGPAGFKLFYQQRLQGHVPLIRQFGAWQESAPVIPDYYDFMSKFIAERVKKNIPIHVIYDKATKADQLGRSDEKILKEIKVVNVNLDLSALITTHGDSVSIHTKEDGAFLGLTIKDRLVSDLVVCMFDFIWDKAVKV